MNIEKGYTKFITDRISEEISKVVVNQEELTSLALCCALSGGHLLIQGVPGLAKTLWVKAFAHTISVDFKRTQFTSDLMPSDVLGTKIYNLKKSEFELKKGPLFTNLFLADEINRTPPKTQSALLEVMEESSITIDGEVNVLEPPFVVFATQNPLEYEGTYPLPEALTDRFMMKVLINYPGVAAEKKILQMYNGGFDAKNSNSFNVNTVCSKEQFLKCKDEIKDVTVDDSIYNYIVSIIETTRRVSVISTGSSPRGTVALLLNAKAYAAMNGRDFVIPDDVKELALPILRHRIVLKPEAEIDGMTTDKIIENILMQVKVPR